MTEQVSSLKEVSSETRIQGLSEEDRLGLEHATLKWNEVEEKKEEEDPKKAKAVATVALPTTTAEGILDSQSDSGTAVSAGEADHKFELKDITVMFPERQLSLITGPTARLVFTSSR